MLVPFIFLTVTLLGGLRLASPDNSFVFLKPALLCLIFALVLLVLFVRGGLIALDEWVNEQFPILTNIANSVVLVTLFAASAQIFNSVMPEQGLPFWVVAFCFLWTLWNNLFADFDNKKLLRSIVALFGFAFRCKVFGPGKFNRTGERKLAAWNDRESGTRGIYVDIGFAEVFGGNRLYSIFRGFAIFHRPAYFAAVFAS